LHVGPLAVSVWRFGELSVVCFGFLACAWCHCELLGSFHPSLPIVVIGRCISLMVYANVAKIFLMRFSEI